MFGKKLMAKAAKPMMLVGALSVFAGVPVAQAASYDVSARFTDGGIQEQTLFNGSFDWNGTTVSNFQGLLSTSMWAWDTTASNFKNKKGGFMDPQYLDLANNCPGDVCSGYAAGDPAWLKLGYQLASSVSGDYVTVSAFRINSTDAVAGGGYNVIGNSTAYGSTDQAARNNNAFFTLVFDKNNPTNTTMTWDDMVYADMTRFGMMMPMVTGWMGMTAHSSGGSMGGLPASLSITAAVPEPETYAMLLVGLGLVGAVARRRRTLA